VSTIWYAMMQKRNLIIAGLDDRWSAGLMGIFGVDTLPTAEVFSPPNRVSGESPSVTCSRTSAFTC